MSKKFTAKAAGAKRATPSKRRQEQVSSDELALFLEAVGEVDPVGGQDVAPLEGPKPPPRPRPQEDFETMMKPGAELSDGFARELALVEQGDTLLYVRPGVQKNLLRKLRRGQFSRSGSLDLHGMTTEEARLAIGRFLAEHREDARRCVRIVHGKGNRSVDQRPVLKQMVNHWLPQRDDVLAFCSAPEHDGGTGAIYVLLRKP